MSVFLQRIGLLGGKGEASPGWPHGTDPLWDDVVFMVDWKEMAKRASPGDTVFDETGRHEFTIPADATLSETIGLTLTSTAILLPDSEDWWVGADGGGTHFCVECYVDLNPNGVAFGQLNFGDYPNSGLWMNRLSGGLYQNGWAYGGSVVWGGTLSYTPGQMHMCINSQGSLGWMFLNKILKGGSTNVENMNNSNLANKISNGTFTMHRWTKGDRRYYDENNLNPDTVFGKGLP